MYIENLLVTTLNERGLRKKSYDTHRSKIKVFCAWLSAQKIYRLERITREAAEAFLKTVASSATTRNAYRGYLKSSFSDLITRKLAKVNPFAGIRKLSEARKVRRYFNARQTAELATIIARENPVLWMGCKMLYYCFIRNTEQCHLPMDDINLDTCTITVHGSYSKNKKTLPVLIPDAFMQDVREWYHRQLVAGAKYFFTVNGGKVSRGDWFTKQFNKVLKRLGYDTEQYSFYSWKNTGAVDFYRLTKDLKALQLQLRHHSLDQVDEYLRELGVIDNPNIRVHSMPGAVKLAA